LRPNLSTVAMAISVVAMFTTDVITVMMKALFSENPTASQSTLE
jgi:hypothetical protein